MDEGLAKFYIACIVLALEYLHGNNIVYRDLKPENVFIDHNGYTKLGDFGFAKVLNDSNRTYTFCGTPGYVAPENVLAHGYNCSVDWWGLGVLMYVLLTGRQPFSTPRTEDPMEVRPPGTAPCTTAAACVLAVAAACVLVAASAGSDSEPRRGTWLLHGDVRLRCVAGADPRWGCR